MKIGDHILYMVQNNQKVAHSLLDDISEDESMVRGGERFNHIRWQVGHLAYCAMISLTLLGEKCEDEEAYKGKYGGGTEISDNQSDYHAFAQLREKLYALQDHMMARLKGMADADLERSYAEGKEAVWKPVTFLGMHDFYHLGQVVHIRKVLGRKRPFG